MHTVIHRVKGIMHITSGTIHNLKKFSAISMFKFTPVVHKDLSANILWG